MNKNYLVIDLMTGAMDGFYINKEDAEAVIKRFEKRYPDGRWILTEVIPTPRPAKDPWCYIPDHMFHTEKLNQKKTA